MAQCINNLAKDLGFDCENVSKGIEKNILLINRNDIDLGGTQISGNKITSLVLKNNKTAFLAEFMKDAHISVSTKPEFSDDDFNGHKHSVVLKFYNKTAEDYDQIDKLVNGASLVAIVENKGNDKDNAFDVLGFTIGLEATEGEGRTNGGIYTLTLSTPANQKEPKTALKWLETDYNTTKAKFDRKLA